MSVFVIGYYAVLIVASALAAHFNLRRVFMPVFILTLVSFLAGILGGIPTLRAITIFVGLLAAAGALSFAFKEFLVQITSPNLSKELKTAPLTASFGIFVIATYAIAGIFAPWIAPHGQAEVIASSFAPASGDMLLGADQLGRDVFSRIIYGARNSVGLAVFGTLLAFVLGAMAGLLAAVKGGWFDQFLGRFSDVIMSIPSLIFALLMLSIFGGSLAGPTTSFWLFFTFALVVGLLFTAARAYGLLGWLVGPVIAVVAAALFSLFGTSIFDPSQVILIVVVAVIYSPRVFRLTRAVAGNIVVMDYIEAAKLRGEGDWYLIRREILPNSTAPLIAEFGLEFVFVFLLIAGLSFLGLGIQPPTADWGSMVRENATLISFGDITPLIPAAAIALLTVSVNFVVDWMLFRSSGLKEQ